MEEDSKFKRSTNFKIIQWEDGSVFINMDDLISFLITQIPNHELFGQLVFFMEAVKKDFLAAKDSYEQKESIQKLWRIFERGYNNGNTSE